MKTQNPFVQEFLDFMKHGGMNVTSQRIAIAEAFFELPGHHSLEEFYNMVAKRDPSIGQTTVYRTLKLLCEARLANEIHFSDDITRYEIAKPTSHHDHLICLECGEIVEIFDRRIETWQNEISEDHGYTLVGHVHNLYGICGTCKAKKDAAARQAL